MEAIKMKQITKSEEVITHQNIPLGNHIISVPNICGGSPVIAGSRIPVWIVAGWYKQGMSLDEIMDTYPHLRPEQICAALTYYFEHQAEIEAEIQENDEANLKYELRKKGLLS
ncbi:DUF433 domain-containing protein [bacterium]|nr:DUF433 domain-containing protein [bacterium]